MKFKVILSLFILNVILSKHVVQKNNVLDDDNDLKKNCSKVCKKKNISSIRKSPLSN